MKSDLMTMWKIKCSDMFDVPPPLLQERRKGGEAKNNLTITKSTIWVL